jgi:hypothetical protein
MERIADSGFGTRMERIAVSGFGTRMERIAVSGFGARPQLEVHAVWASRIPGEICRDVLWLHVTLGGDDRRCAN